MKKELTALAFILIVFLLMWTTSRAQCWEDLPLIRRDTAVTAGIFVIEPRVGERAVITFEKITAVEIVREDFIVSGPWTHATATADPYLNRDCYYSNTVGASLAMNVEGDSLHIYTATAGHHGSMGVTLNQGTEKIVSLYSALRKEEVKVYSTTLPVGANSIRLRVLGGGYTVIDFVRVFSK